MIRKSLSTMLAVGLASAAMLSNAADRTVEKPARVVSTMVKTAAIVESVNDETRELRLIDARGNRFSVFAGDEVRNFDQIRPRDRIVTEYVESVAIVVAPAGAGAEALEGQFGATAVAPAGDKPGVRNVQTSVVVASVQAINLADRLATLQTKDGEVRTIKVSANARLDLVNVGDQVQLRVTRAIAVSVVKPSER